MSVVYDKIMEHANKYGATIAWRKKKHAAVIEKHLHPDEEVMYAFCAQKGLNSAEFFNTHAIALTNRRIIIAQKRVLPGYLFLAITPDMFNDITIKACIIWSKIIIDTVKEKVYFSNISKKSTVDIQRHATDMLMRARKKHIKVESPQQSHTGFPPANNQEQEDRRSSGTSFH